MAVLPPGALPNEVTSFVGRKQEIAELVVALQTVRLLTLTGTGGVGKTRLALEVAARRQSSLDDGARFVDLASIGQPDAVAGAVVAALGLRPEPRRSALDTLLHRLYGRQLLLVLDNCEHLLDGCRALAQTLLRRCPGLSILATSREPLGLAGESVWAVPALQLPPHPPRDGAVSVESLLESEAGRLFLERATAANSSFELRPDNAQSVAEICWQLDGIPLAIELAAVRTRFLTVEQLAERLDDRFRLLSSGPGGATPRHQTLRATVDWSYDLLSETERTLFNRLSVFTGGWALEAAEAVCSDDGVDAHEVVRLLGRLVECSLVQADEQSGAMRYRLFETLRQYGAERLAQAGDEHKLRNRHREWCVRLAEEGERDIWRADQVQCVERLAREHDNVRAALDWTLRDTSDAEPGLRIAAAMVRFWDVHGDLGEGMRWLTELLALPSVRPHTLGWARAQTARAYLTILTGDLERGVFLLDETLPFWRALPDSRGLAIALFFRGLAVAWNATDLRSAEPIFSESLKLAEQRGPRWTVYFCLYCLGETARLQGDLARAEALLSQALELASESHDRWGAVYAEYGLAFRALAAGDRRAATEHARCSLKLSVELGDTRGATYALEVLACIAAADRQARRAARLFGAAEALREPVGEFMSASLHVARDESLADVRAELGARVFATAFASGRGLTLDEAVALALAVDTDPPSSLTSRELEVARLVAEGLSNREIAAALVLTERTTESHLTHIFTKLGVRSRTQLATWAIERGVSEFSTMPDSLATKETGRAPMKEEQTHGTGNESDHTRLER